MTIVLGLCLNDEWHNWDFRRLNVNMWNCEYRNVSSHVLHYVSLQFINLKKEIYGTEAESN